MQKLFLQVLAFTSLSVCLLTSVATAQADVGPPIPSLHFNFTYKVPHTSVNSIQILNCVDSECRNTQAIITSTNGSNGPNILQCDGDQCWASLVAQKPDAYLKLVITFSDLKTRGSNAFTRLAYSAEYNVIVEQDDLQVTEIAPKSIFNYFGPLQFLLFIPALLVTLVIEYVVARLYSRHINFQIKGVIWANLLSLPVVWFVFPFLPIDYIAIFILAEVFAVGFEAGFLFLVNHQRGLLLRGACIASLCMNLSSVVGGLILVLAIIAVPYINYVLNNPVR